MPLNKQWITGETKYGIKITGHNWKHKHNDPKYMECSKVVLGGKFIAIQANSGNKAKQNLR